MILPIPFPAPVPAVVPPIHPPAAALMALPDRAYGERQALSPIRLVGVIQHITCEAAQCRVEIQVQSVERNQTPAPLGPGQTITVLTGAPEPAPGGDPSASQAPLIGKPRPSVRIPPVATLTRVWLRPAAPMSTQPSPPLYALTSGPYGFGPNLEGLTTLQP